MEIQEIRTIGWCVLYLVMPMIHKLHCDYVDDNENMKCLLQHEKDLIYESVVIVVWWV